MMITQQEFGILSFQICLVMLVMLEQQKKRCRKGKIRLLFPQIVDSKITRLLF